MTPEKTKKLKAALARTNRRMRHDIPVTIAMSRSELDMLRSDFFSKMEEAAKAEIGKDRKPATIALRDFKKWDQDKMRKFLVESCVRKAVDAIVRHRITFIITKAAPTQSR